MSRGNYGLVVLGPSGIQMDTPKAMAVLGFSPSQTFEVTSMDEINKKFMQRLHQMLRFEKKKHRNPKEIERRRHEMKRINEALQCLIKKRYKSQAIGDWKKGGKRSGLVALALRSLDEEAQKALDIDYKEAQEKYFEMEKLESERAQELALEIVAGIEGPNEHKLSKSNSLRKRKQGRLGSNNSDGSGSTEEITKHEITKQRSFTPLPPSRYKKHETRHSSFRSKSAAGLKKSELSNSNPDLSIGLDDEVSSENFDDMQSAMLQMNLYRVQTILNNLSESILSEDD